LTLNLLIVFGCLIYGRFMMPFDVGGMVEQAYLWFQAVFVFTSIVACALVLTRRGVLFTNPKQAFLAAIPLLALLVVGLTSGYRGRLMWLVFLLTMMGILNRQTKFVAIGIIVAVFTVPLFAFLGSSYRSSNEAEKISSVQYKVIALLYEEGKSRLGDMKSMGEEFLSALAWRAQGPRNSAVLYQQYDKGAGAGFTTYLGSIFFPIPRLVWAEKPAAGSTDSSISSSAIYKVMELGYGYDAGSTMGPCLASAHAYWEGGWSWLIIAGFITGLIWNIIFKLSRRLPEGIAIIVVFAFAAALLIDGMLTMMCPLYAIILTWWQWVLPVLLAYHSTELLFVRNRVSPSAVASV